MFLKVKTSTQFGIANIAASLRIIKSKRVNTSELKRLTGLKSYPMYLRSK